MVWGTKIDQMAPGSVALILAGFAIALGVSSLADIAAMMIKINSGAVTDDLGIIPTLVIVAPALDMLSFWILPTILGVWAYAKARKVFQMGIIMAHGPLARHYFNDKRHATIAQMLVVAGPFISLLLVIMSAGIPLMFYICHY